MKILQWPCSILGSFQKRIHNPPTEEISSVLREIGELHKGYLMYRMSRKMVLLISSIVWEWSSGTTYFYSIKFEFF